MLCNGDISREKMAYARYLREPLSAVNEFHCHMWITARWCEWIADHVDAYNDIKMEEFRDWLDRWVDVRVDKYSGLV